MPSVAVSRDAELRSQTAMSPSASWRQTVGLAMLLAAITVLLYFRVYSYPFVNYDDTLYVTQNAHVQEGLTWSAVRWGFTTYHVGTWHPLTWLSHALDCQLFDLDPAGPHAVNLLLHVLNVMALFWVLQRATGFSGRSFMVAALFALHPINVESVVWIAERKNSLSMLFFLLALGAYRWYTINRKPGRYAVVAVLFALGLMAKPQVITLPFVLLLWDYWPLRRFASGAKVPALPKRGLGRDTPAWLKFSQLLWEKVPLLALAGISAALTMAAQRADGTKTSYSLSLRVEYAIVSYVQYLGKAVWPARLSPFYPHPDYVPLWQAACAALFLALVTAVVVAVRPRRPYLLVGWLWFLGTLVPMLGFEGVGYQGKQGIADRYAYLPFIGLFIMVCWLVAELSRPFGKLRAGSDQQTARSEQPFEMPRPSQQMARTGHPGLFSLARDNRTGHPSAVLCGLSVAVLFALGAVAYRQLGYWRDNVTLWTHAVEVTEGNFLAENNLGKALLADGRVDEGVSHFRKAVAIYPADPVANLNIGIYEQQRGNFEAAIERYKKTISLAQDRELKAAAQNNLSRVYRQMGNIDAAQQSEDAAKQGR